MFNLTRSDKIAGSHLVWLGHDLPYLNLFISVHFRYFDKISEAMVIMHATLQTSTSTF